MSAIKIKLGEPQPMPCHECGEKYGYQITENIKTTYSTFYDSDGEHTGGDYGGTMKRISGGIIAYCMNCNTKLPFTIQR
jgi:hypothetical protein